MIRRFHKIRENLSKEKLDGYLTFDQSNIFYLTDFLSQNQILLITKNSVVLFVPPLIYEQIKDNVKNFQIINTGNKWKDVLGYHIKQLKNIGFDDDRINFKTFKEIKKLTRAKWKAKNVIQELRIVKEKDEIEKIKNSCEIAKSAVIFGKKILKAGITEKDIANRIGFFIKKFADDVSFDIIVASGKNSAYPHHKSSNYRLRKNDAVIIDLGCIYKGYCSDLTRTFFLGRIPYYQKKIYNIVENSQKQAIEKIKDKVLCKDIDFTVRNIIKKAGFGKHFIHNAGHGIGIDVHEKPIISPDSKETLKKGMAVTVEPGIYIPNKFGVRIEDTILVKKNGYEVLTK